MNLHLTLGAWIIPLAITIALFLWALIPRSDERQSGSYDFTFWLPAAFRFFGAVIGALVAWLVWSLLR